MLKKMWKRMWKRIWKTKLEIAKINRDVEFKKIANDAAHNIAFANTDNAVIGQPHRKYKEIYDLEYQRILDVLSGNVWMHSSGCSEIRNEAWPPHK